VRSRSCIIDGEAVACNDNGIASFDLVRHHRANDSICLYAFDLIELNRPASIAVLAVSFLQHSLQTLSDLRSSKSSSGSRKLRVHYRLNVSHRPPNRLRLSGR
jgi:hypothetical protein